MESLGRRALISAAGAAATVPLANARAAAEEAPSQAQPPRGLSLRGIWAQDPFIVADRPSGTYHLYVRNHPEVSGVPGTGTMMYRSWDLSRWQGPYVVFTVPAHNWAAEGGWAPEVHRHNGRWYLFTTLHDEEQPLAEPPEVLIRTYRRGTAVAVGDSPYGPFELLATDRPGTPDELMALDGTLFVEDGVPWMVYAHEWVQRLDGTVEAVRLSRDLRRPVGNPVHLFKASDAPWLNDRIIAGDRALPPYVTDGPQLFRSRSGELLMLWSTYRGPAGTQGCVQAQARSVSGRLAGPWVQGPPLMDGDSGHGMAFSAFDGTLLMVLDRSPGTPDARAKLYELRDAGDRFELGPRRADLDGGD